MKTLSLVSFFFLFFNLFPGFAQEFDLSHQSDFFTHAESVEAAGDGQWWAGGTRGNYFGYPGFRPAVWKVDESGQVLWESVLEPTFGIELGEVTAIKAVPDGNIVVAGWVSGCDYGLPGFLVKLDQAGDTIWSKVMPTVGFSGPVFMDLYDNGDLFLFTPPFVSRRDASGNLLNEVQLSFDFYGGSDALTLPGGNAVITGDFGLSVLDASLAFTASAFEDQNIRAIEPAEGGAYYLLFENEAARVSPAFEVLATYALEEAFVMHYLRAYEEGLWLAGANQEGVPSLIHLNPALSPLNTIAYGDTNMVVNALALSGSQVGVAGLEYGGIFDGQYTSHSWGSSLFLKAFPITGVIQQPAQTDAGVTDVRVAGGFSAELQGFCYFEDDSVEVRNYNDVYVTVTNFGSEILQEVTLNFRFPRCMGICFSTFAMQQSYSGLNIAPGQSEELYYGHLQVYEQAVSAPRELCCWTSVPNQRIDANHGNDRFCKNVDEVGISEEEPDSGFSILQSPVAGDLQVEWKGAPGQAVTFQLYSMSGRLIRTLTPVAAPQSLTIDLKGLQSGVYLLKASGKGGQYVQRFVKL